MWTAYEYSIRPDAPCAYSPGSAPSLAQYESLAAREADLQFGHFKKMAPCGHE
jgi:hypothetical protein